MKKTIASIALFLLMLGFIGCGENSSDNSIEPATEIKTGLSDSTYLNTKYGIRITNLPMDSWTVKALGSDLQGMKVQSDLSYISYYHLLLMEPVTPDQFIGTDNLGYLDPVTDAGIPFITVGVNYQKGVSFETYQISDDLDQFAASNSYQIESKKPVYIGNSSGIQAILYREEDSTKVAVTWFAKDEIAVRCEYRSGEAEFDKYIDTYNKLANNFWLME